VAVCLRPHNILLVADDAEAQKFSEQDYNLFRGTIHRSIYFGDAVDYTIDLPNQGTLRVVTPPNQRFPAGQHIYAAAHPDHCVVVRN
jgi:hypothetical protein